MWTKIKAGLKRFFHRRRLIRYGIYLFVLILLFIFRAPILRGMGNWLINEDPLEKADVIVELGGNSMERSAMAAQLYKFGYAPRVLTTGSNESGPLLAIGLHLTEAENSKQGLMRYGVPDSLIDVLNEGTSTIEEAEALKKYALSHHFKRMIVVTSKFHTARVHKYFNRVFKNSEVALIVRGADPLKYKTDHWWYSEEGLMMVNNEYVKSFYYWWKY
jgi:uncharacterized SAM-binding protein YcdF (DUF218 family)